MKNMTDINIVLDRSGSMSNCRAATIEAFNGFLESQRNGPDEATASLYRFDHEYEPVYEGKDIDSAPKLSERNFIPRGSTALFDAIGRTIDSIGARLTNTPEYERPNKVVVVIVTDGLENVSKEYSRKRIFDMIHHQEDKYHWTFVYMGANQDAYTEASHMGFASTNTLNFVPTAAGLKCSTQVLGRNLTQKIRSSSGGQSCKSFYDAADQAEADALVDKTADKTPVPTGGSSIKKLINAATNQPKIKGTRLNIRKRIS